MTNQAIIPKIISAQKQTYAQNIFFVAAGMITISLLAQVSIPLPFTPVPITGQTFAVSLLALLFGRKLGSITLAGYLILGAAGLPVFSAGRSGLVWGPTFGYLVGMLLASYAVGYLADRGWARSFGKAYLAASIGSIFIFSAGLTVLSFFVPLKGLLLAGLYPFLIGDFIKNIAAAALASKLSNLRR